MERLTYRTIKGEAMGNSSVADIGDILGKLADYEDLDEQGLLLKLPCKVGDIVYMIINQRDNYDDTIYQIVSATSFGLSMIDNIGKTVFLTQAEAEQKLKEMESD